MNPTDGSQLGLYQLTNLKNVATRIKDFLCHSTI